MPSVVVTCTVDEEYAFTGAAALTGGLSQFSSDENGTVPLPALAVSSGGLIPGQPAAAVVAEPTDLDVIVAHKGVVRWRCHTRGRATHSAQGAADDNAIYKMARLLTGIERYQRDVTPGLAAHPLCGPVTANVGTIHGGSSINIVPERCQIELELRLPPGVTPAAARGHLLDYLATEAPLEPPPEHDPPYMAGPPLGDEANGQVAERLAATAGEVTGRDCRRRGVAFATEAAFFARAGCPAVVFGPGSIQQAHTDDEWLSLEQLHEAAEIFYRFVMSWKS
jgi:acetylornithine deacetylase